MNIRQFFQKHYPIFALGFLIILLFTINYRSETILSGWDNLHPEFDFGVNIGRSIFAVWQEYQGLGLLGGMAHATDLLRQILLQFLSLFLPINSLRYVWTFLMLFVGSSGAYFLIKYILGQEELRIKNQELRQDKSIIHNSYFIIPTLGACFYLLNLATMQMFSVPFEAFIGFFGFLPWILMSSILYYQNPTRKRLIFLLITLLLATPAWYIQTLFVVFMITLCILLIAFIHKSPKKKAFSKTANLFGIIFLVNSFWLLPVAYFTTTNSQVNLNSKINQMATETILSQNKEFGTLPDVMQLKGFMLNGVDPNSTGTITYMLKPWRDHLSNPFINIVGYLLFAIVFIGFIKTIKSKSPAKQGFAWLFIFVLFALAIDTPPFSFVNTLFRNHLPLANQVFRFPFTKFSTLASLAFAVMFAVGIETIIKKLESGIRNHELWPPRKILVSLIPYSLFIILILFTLPAFRGNLFYDKEHAKIPREYYQLFTFFKQQDPNTRIANFPQSNFWGWSFYKWNYGGSGFLWYGIRQPILDRAFDVWSNYNENYYFEVSQAVYSKNAINLEKVLNKYQVNWVLVDKNIFDPSSSKALFFTELEELLDTGTYARKTATFGKLEVYRINLTNKPKSFVFMGSHLPVVNKYNWNNFDQAYFENGNYISALNSQLSTLNSFYPFRSLFSQKTQKENEFNIKENATSIDFTAQLPTRQAQGGPAYPKTTFIIPAFSKTEKVIPLKLTTEKTNTGTRLIAKVLLPQVFIDKKELTQNNGPVFQLPIPPTDSKNYPLKVNINGASSFEILNENKDVGVVFFHLNAKNILTISNKNKQGISEITFAPEIFSQLTKTDQSIDLPQSQTEQTLTVRFPKIDDNYLSFNPELKTAEKIRNCDKFRKGNYSAKTTNQSLSLSSINADACTSFSTQNLPHDQAYAIFIKSKHVTGSPLRFWVENINEQHAPIDTYLPKFNKTTTSSFILAPMEPFGNSYSFHFDNMSIGRNKTENEINNLAVYPIFYNYLQALKIQINGNESSGLVDISNLNVTHPNESLYIVNLSTLNSQLSTPTTLILSQAYNPGWKAYRIESGKWRIENWLKTAFPFIFGKEIKQHVMVNNWQNGWILDNSQLSTLNSQLIIVYLPQYLQYLGFLMLFMALFVIIFYKNKFPRMFDKRSRI